MSNKNHKQSLITDVAIIGGGIAGSTAAVLLQNAGINALLIDPHHEMPKDFRCEKFNRDQMETLERLGISEKIYSKCTPIKDVWIARKGKLVNKLHYPHYGFSYETAINAIRDYLHFDDRFITGKVKAIQPSGSGTELLLSDGRKISARMVIMANGLNPGLRKQLDVEQTMLSKHHEMAIGFDIKPTNDTEFGFESFTFWPEKSSEKLAYFTVFKSGENYRVNMFGYWEKNDPFMLHLQNQPEKTLAKLMPSLNKLIGDFKVASRVHVRPVDLYQNHPEACNSVVFVGDAYSTSCPGAGTGTTKAVADIEILCSKYIPKWLEEKTVTAQLISEFYNDPEKIKSDADSFNEAYFLKSLTMETSLIWGARRWARFFYHLGKGAIKDMPNIKEKMRKAS